MKRTIKVDGKELEFEANLGTTELYEMLTGKNLFEELSENKRRPNDPDADKKPARIMSLYKKLAFVMHIQATEPDIREMKGKMTMDAFITWCFGFGPQAFDNDFINAITDLWSGSNKPNVESKNP